ncbi:MAG: cytidine deaminase [Saprospiraceae bacterium]|nr:cytidine deaminase [Saprospiraceae bacterium]
MKEILYTTAVQVFDSENELTEPEQLLLVRAYEALSNAYVPYSGFHVGAAVLLANGAIESGANQENAAYPMCLCAERTALAVAAMRHPGIPVMSIAVRVRKKEGIISKPAGPCGACRQVLSEWEDRYNCNISVLLQGEKGVVFRIPNAKSLLPLSFDRSFL